MKRAYRIIRSYLPIFGWVPTYNRSSLVNDLIVGGVVTMMLIPQSLAYAQLAGLPAQVGLYASMAPLILYAIFGTSRTLSVGPVAVVSLMTAAAAGQIASQGTPEYLGAAISLALISGLLLLLMGLLRLGFLANFLSHPVISGFITASAIQIAVSQFAPLLGIKAEGENLLDVSVSLVKNAGQIVPYTAVIGVISLAVLFWMRKSLQPLLMKLKMGPRASDILAKAGPAVVIIITIAIVGIFGFASHGVSIVGTVPKGLPAIAVPHIDLGLFGKLIVPALLISIVGYVESISVALTLAAKRRQRVDPDQELIALGASNVGSSFSGGFPVTGGFARSVVNFQAGAETPAAGVYTAIGIALVVLFLTPLLFFLPKATLGATIIVAVLSLADFKALKCTFIYSKADFAAMVATILVTWAEGVEIGLVAGVGLSIFLHLYKTSRPHVAVVGQIPGTMSFRNVTRHKVVTNPGILSLRVDESLYFPNSRFLEEYINDAVAANPAVRHVILECPAVNAIDSSGLESLEAINQRLKDGGIMLHLSEVKGPVMDRLKRSHFLEELSGQVHLTQFDAISAIDPDLADETLKATRPETS